MPLVFYWYQSPLKNLFEQLAGIYLQFAFSGDITLRTTALLAPSLLFYAYHTGSKTLVKTLFCDSLEGRLNLFLGHTKFADQIC